MRSSVLLVDDDLEFAEVMADALAGHGYTTDACASGPACLARLDARPADVVVADLDMDGMNGAELCGRIKVEHPDTLVLMLTGRTEVEAAVASLHAGALDYLRKPTPVKTLALAIARVQEHRRLAREVMRLREERLPTAQHGISGGSLVIEHVREMVTRTAPLDVTVLITGESGTGKELVARAIHRQSRPHQPFVAINCAAMPAELIESELFGHAQGAFTDAKTSRPGLFVRAGRGTVFLDEIGEMPPSAQVKLLRVLQERKVRPLGEGAEVRVHARVVTATNRDLEVEVANHRFREDLYYRINVVEIAVPALRDRDGDILPLAQHFLEAAAARTGKEVRGISPWAARALAGYSWPGNVRELENSMERAVALCRLDEITVEDLPPKMLGPQASFVTKDLANYVTLEEAVGLHVRKVLAATGGNRTRAAEILHVDRRSLLRRLQHGDEARRDRLSGTDRNELDSGSERRDS